MPRQKRTILTPYNVAPFSGRKVWWRCPEGHEWQAAIGNRVRRGDGCPYCAGQKVSESNSLANCYPNLAREWHPTRNGELTADGVTARSGRKAWWKCNQNHEWETIISSRSSRSNGSSCPYCAGKKAYADNCLSTTHCHLAATWHPAKNGNLTPGDVTAGSNQKVWWRCPKGHEWEATVKHRVSGQGCPYCAGKRVSELNCFEVKFPKISKEWHKIKNGALKPADVSYGSRRKVWWKCGKGHEWKASIADRRKNNCPFCSGNRVSETNCLALKRPNLIEEWDYEKNGELTPNDVSFKSHKKVWWQCQQGHVWKAEIANRAVGRGCPYCSNNKKDKNNCLSATHPMIAREWDDKRNKGLTPEDVSFGSDYKVHWKCSKGHRWLAYIYSRTTMGRGCPHCYKERRRKKSKMS